MGVNDLGNVGEGVGIARDSDKVGNNETGNGKHGSTSVSDLGLSEEGDKRLVCLRETKGVELEFSSLEINTSSIFIPHGVDSGGGSGCRGGGKGGSAGDEGGNDGGLHDDGILQVEKCLDEASLLAWDLDTLELACCT